MKKIQQEVKTYKDIYVSVDGKNFETEADCREWEKSYRGTLEASWNKVKKVEVNSASLGLPWSGDDHECYIIKPKDLDEIVLINAYIDCTTCSGTMLLTTEHIGKLIALNFGYDHDYCDRYLIDDILVDIKNYIAKMADKLEEVQ